jgi:hypothetical protein
MKTFIYKVLPLVLALALGGCGGGGSTPATGSAPNTGDASAGGETAAPAPAVEVPLAATDAKNTVVDAVDKYVGVWKSCKTVPTTIFVPGPPGSGPIPLRTISSEEDTVTYTKLTSTSLSVSTSNVKHPGNIDCTRPSTSAPEVTDSTIVQVGTKVIGTDTVDLLDLTSGTSPTQKLVGLVVSDAAGTTLKFGDSVLIVDAAGYPMSVSASKTFTKTP